MYSILRRGSHAFVVLLIIDDVSGHDVVRTRQHLHRVK